MLKLKKGINEYEVLGHITFRPELGVETVEVEGEEVTQTIYGDAQTNYTIVIDGVTTTIESTDTEYEVIDVPDPVVEPEPIVEPEPLPSPVIPEPTPEELARNAWLEQFQILERSLRAKEKLEAVGLSFSTEEQARFDQLVAWVASNRKIEYVAYM